MSPTKSADDFYDLLGVAQGASSEEIRHAYRKRAAEVHPDRHHGNPLESLAQEQLQRLNEAYRVLSDPAERARYDAELQGHRFSPSGGGAGAGVPVDGAHFRRSVLRAVLVSVGVVVALRLVGVVGRGVAAGLGVLGQPATLALAGAGALGLMWWWRRRSKRRP